MKREKYIKWQRVIEGIEKIFQSLVILTPLMLAGIGFIFFGGIAIAFNKEILGRIDQLGPVESYLRYTEYSIGIANLILGTITIILVVYTLFTSKRANNKQLFETKFFDLLNIHRENTIQVECNHKTGRKAFEEIFAEIQFISNQIERNISTIPPNDRVTISYLVVFWGLNETKEDLRKYLNKYYPQLGQIRDEILNKLLELYGNINAYDSNSPFKGKLTGLQSSLSHYFRHLFQTIEFINKQVYLTLDEKYYYVKTLRAQLSNYELIIFFYNSISPLGRNWELSQNEFRNKLVTKYQFIKNMPLSLVIDIDAKEFYPEMEFESDEV
jgi:Putative phage abortive infection protein